MDIQSKRNEYAARMDELKKYQDQLAAEHDKVSKTLIALGGAVEALDDLLKEPEPALEELKPA